MNLLWFKEAKWLDCSSLSEAEFILISVQWSFLKLCLFVYLHGRGRWVQMLRSEDNLKEVLLFCYVWVLESQLRSSSLAAIVWGHLAGPSSVIFFFQDVLLFRCPLILPSKIYLCFFVCSHSDGRTNSDTNLRCHWCFWSFPNSTVWPPAAASSRLYETTEDQSWNR